MVLNSVFLSSRNWTARGGATSSRGLLLKEMIEKKDDFSNVINWRFSKEDGSNIWATEREREGRVTLCDSQSTAVNWGLDSFPCPSFLLHIIFSFIFFLAFFSGTSLSSVAWNNFCVSLQTFVTCSGPATRDIHVLGEKQKGREGGKKKERKKVPVRGEKGKNWFPNNAWNLNLSQDVIKTLTSISCNHAWKLYKKSEREVKKKWRKEDEREREWERKGMHFSFSRTRNEPQRPSDPGSGDTFVLRASLSSFFSFLSFLWLHSFHPLSLPVKMKKVFLSIFQGLFLSFFFPIFLSSTCLKPVIWTAVKK